MAMLNNQMVTQYIMVTFALQDGTLRHNPSGMRVPWLFVVFFGWTSGQKMPGMAVLMCFWGRKKHDTDWNIRIWRANVRGFNRCLQEHLGVDKADLAAQAPRIVRGCLSNGEYMGISLKVDDGNLGGPTIGNWVGLKYISPTATMNFHFPY